MVFKRIIFGGYSQTKQHLLNINQIGTIEQKHQTSNEIKHPMKSNVGTNKHHHTEH
jgi:hypothetical protein